MARNPDPEMGRAQGIASAEKWQIMTTILTTKNTGISMDTSWITG